MSWFYNESRKKFVRSEYYQKNVFQYDESGKTDN